MKRSNRTTPSRRSSIIPAIALLTTLSACSGGGGGSISPPPAPPPPPPPPVTQDPDWQEINSTELRRQPAFADDNINVLTAYEQGLTGAGILVGHVDTGIDVTHSELEGQIDEGSTNTAIVGGGIAEAGDNRHGTWTGGIIVAKKDGYETHGIAYDAKLISFNADDRTRSTACHPFRCGFNVNSVSTAIDLAVEAGARVVSLSLAQNWELDPTLLASVIRAVDAGVLLVVSGGNQYLPDPAPWPGMIATHPDVLGGLIIAGATQNTGSIETRAHWQPNLTPGDANVGSNAAGYGIDVTLFAPGTARGPWPNVGTIVGSGTSASAPFIAGAAALLFQHSPHLTGREVAQILFETATDLGAPGDDEIYGQGLLNVGAALEPLGTTTVASSTGVLFPVTGMGMVVSPGFGDALSPTVGFASGLLMQDKYRRTYQTDLQKVIQSRGLQGVDFMSILQNERRMQGDTVRFGESQLSVSFIDRMPGARRLAPALPMSSQSVLEIEYPTVFLASPINKDLTLTGATGLSSHQVMDRMTDRAGPPRAFIISGALTGATYDTPGSRRGLGAIYKLSEETNIAVATTVSQYQNIVGLKTRNTSPKAVSSQIGISSNMKDMRLGARFGITYEDGAVLGSVSGGALSLGNTATTLQGRAEASIPLEDGYVFGFVESGYSQVSVPSHSLLTGMTGFWTSAMVIGYVQEGLAMRDDVFGIAISQPMRVENGHINATLPTAGKYGEGSLAFTNHQISLSPTAREIDLEVSYRWRKNGYSFSANAIGMRHAGHSKANPWGAGVLLRLSRGF